MNNGCSLLSLILAKLLLSDTNSENVFALFIVTASGIATGGIWGLQLPSPLSLAQLTSYIIKTVQTKCIIGEALKVGGSVLSKVQNLRKMRDFGNFCALL